MSCVEDGGHDVISRRKVLPSGECTRSVCLMNIQQRLPVPEPFVLVTFIVRQLNDSLLNGITSFYRTMRHSAKRGIAIACHPSVRASVCNVGGSGAHRLKILDGN